MKATVTLLILLATFSSMPSFAGENLIGRLTYHVISDIHDNDPVETNTQTRCVKDINKVVINKSTTLNDPEAKSCDIAYTIEDINGKTQKIRNYSSFDYDIPTEVEKKIKFIGIHPGWLVSLGMLQDAPFQVYTVTTRKSTLEDASMIDLTARCYMQVQELINLSCSAEDKNVMHKSMMIKQRQAELKGAIMYLND